MSFIPNPDRLRAGSWQSWELAEQGAGGAGSWLGASAGGASEIPPSLSPASLGCSP